MGKKRSKTSKQKQARASKRFGVSVKKGGGREQVTSPLVLEAKSSKRAHSSTPSTKKTTTRQGLVRKQNFVKTQLPLQTEQADFNLELKSMEERLHAKFNKKMKIKSSWSMSPATFCVKDKDKSTQRLVEEATTKVQALQDIGQSTPIQQQKDNRLQVLAAQHRLAAWSAEKEEPVVSQNAFAALQQSDSDDEDDHGWGVDDATKEKPPLFQFAPASFGVPTNTGTIQEGEDDPDL